MRMRSTPLAPVLGRALLTCLLLATACERGPEEPVLTEDLQHRIDARFAEDHLTIRSLQRTGSAPFRDAERGTSGVFVYYDAALEFLRDYNLTSWQGLNLGTLAFALGATESGIKGFKPEGNRSGDVLRVHGRLSYEEDGRGWKPTSELPPSEVEAAIRTRTLEGAGPRAVLRRVRELVERDPKAAPGTRDSVILDELKETMARVDLSFARMEGHLTLGTRRPPGTYYDFGAAFTHYATEHGLPIHNYPSDGSLENGFDVDRLSLDFGLVQSDVAETQFHGWPGQEQLPHTELRSIASLWPEAVHIVTLEGAGIERIADLRGKRISVGEPESGSRFNAVRIAIAAGMQRPHFAEIHQVGTAKSIAFLESGEVDALLTTEAVPSRALQALAQRRPDVRFVPVDPDIVGRLSDEYFAYYPFTVPARTYPGQTKSFVTLGLAAVLVTNRFTSDEHVERVLEMILESANALSKVFYRAGFISKETMRLGIAVPLHPAAARFYDQRTGTTDGPSRDRPPQPQAGEPLSDR